MSITLFNLTHDVAAELGILVSGVATGGNTTTVIDTVDRTESDDHWNGGGCWITYDAGGAGAAPQGECKEISDFANSTSTITVRSAFSLAVSSGDRYAVSTRRVPYEVITQKINQVLYDFGKLPYVDTTSITIATSQTEYDLPAAAKGGLLQVFAAQNTDSDDNRWQEIFNWYIKTDTPGLADTLVLPYQLNTGYGVMLVYEAYHPQLTASTSVLSEYVPKERVIIPATLECYKYMKEHTGWDRWDDKIVQYENKVAEFQQRRPYRLPTKPGNIVLVRRGQTGKSPGDAVNYEDGGVLWG